MTHAGTRSDAFLGAIDIMPTCCSVHAACPCRMGYRGGMSQMCGEGSHGSTEEGLALQEEEIPVTAELMCWKHRTPYIYKTWQTVGQIGMVG